VRHVGVEAYESMPDDLPAYVEWIVNTADKMSGVENSSVDLVFAGQTTEHLWADELAGFLLESHRVLTERPAHSRQPQPPRHGASPLEPRRAHGRAPATR
jgi:hypothetical protein